MRRLSCLAPVLTLALLPAFAADAPKLPQVGGKPAVATVNGDAITLEQFRGAVAEVHREMAESGQPVKRQNPDALLERMINARLIVGEARSMGLDKLPEVVAAVDGYGRNALKSAYYQSIVDPDKPMDTAALDRIFRDLTTKVTMQSVLATIEADAKAFAADVRAGKDFSAAAKALETAKKAQISPENEAMALSEVLPGMKSVVSALQPGQIAGPIKLPNGYAVVKLFKRETVTDPAEVEKARTQAMKDVRVQALDNATRALAAKYATTDEALLGKLDFEAKVPGFEAMLKDQRPVVKIQGEAPITVGELTQALGAKYFHGVDRAITKKSINARVPGMLQELVRARVVRKEALRLGLDKSPAYRADVNEFRDGQLFTAFIQKAVDPDIKVAEDDVKRYYDAHAADYSTPPMVRLEALAFHKREDAEKALAKLRQGADIAWLRANTSGLVPHDGDPDLIEFPPTLIVTDELPDGVRQAVSGAKSGDYRFYAGPKGPSYVLHVMDTAAPHQQKLDEVRDEVTGKVRLDKRQAAFDDYVGKLRKAADIKIFAKGDQLLALVTQGLGPAR